MRLFVIFIILSLNTSAFSIEYRDIIVGAERVNEYLPLLKDKKVGVVANQTSMIKNTHLVDSLLKLKVNIVTIFCPEHGFRGEAGAGEHIVNTTDSKMGLPIISLYGNKKKPSAEDLKNIDIIIFDIQDVGVRFYTYISTMHYVMEACAENNIEFLVLDRPNPNGFYVDGPVLKKSFSSFVGMHPVPVVHGLTIAEYAQMINGEGWLKNGIKCKLLYVLCKNYNHLTFYKLPVKPSPNLPNMTAVYLYPSLCFFEGTVMSVGRGTDFPFQVIGHPKLQNTDFTFTPRSISGVATNPPYKDMLCYGYDLRIIGSIIATEQHKIFLQWLIDAYENFPDKDNFFNDFFYKLAGNMELQEQIKNGLPEQEIRKFWENDLIEYKKIRKKYLLYEDFEN